MWTIAYVMPKSLNFGQTESDPVLYFNKGKILFYFIFLFLIILPSWNKTDFIWNRDELSPFVGVEFEVRKSKTYNYEFGKLIIALSSFLLCKLVSTDSFKLGILYQTEGSGFYTEVKSAVYLPVKWNWGHSQTCFAFYSYSTIITLWPLWIITCFY